ncbi:MAG: hypothetical protein Q8Q12_05730, partial [bacterium]|nr:hypothetical protein [bacterium]
ELLQPSSLPAYCPYTHQFSPRPTLPNQNLRNRCLSAAIVDVYPRSGLELPALKKRKTDVLQETINGGGMRR